MSALALGGVNPIAGTGSGASIHYFGGAQASDASYGSPPTSSDSDPINSTFKQLVDALQSVSGEQASLDGAARQLEAQGSAVSPGEMVMLSMRCDEFMFHCELTSNAANRSSDGLQQLFREQS